MNKSLITNVVALALMGVGYFLLTTMPFTRAVCLFWRDNQLARHPYAV